MTLLNTDNTFLHTHTSSAGVLCSEKLLWQYLNAVSKMIHIGVGTIRASKMFDPVLIKTK